MFSMNYATMRSLENGAGRLTVVCNPLRNGLVMHEIWSLSLVVMDFPRVCPWPLDLSISEAVPVSLDDEDLSVLD